MIKLLKDLTKEGGVKFSQSLRTFLFFILPVLVVNTLPGQDSNQTGFSDSTPFELDTSLNQVAGYNPENSGFSDSNPFTLDTTGSASGNAENNQTGFADSDSFFTLDTTDQVGPAPDTIGFNDSDSYFTLDTTDGNQSGNSSSGELPNSNNVNSFQASSIPDLKLWLDANDVESFTLAENNVTAWSDKSGNGHVLDQVFGPAVPIR